MEGSSNTPQLSRNVKRLAHLDLPGAGQVYVQGNYAYIGHLPNQQNLGTTIVFRGGDFHFSPAGALSLRWANRQPRDNSRKPRCFSVNFPQRIAPKH